MRRIILVMIAALSLGGCAGTVPPWLLSAEQKAADLYSKVKARLPVIQGEIDSGIGAVCGHLPEIKAGVDTLAAGFTNPGPKTRNFIATADESIASAMAACASWTADSSKVGSIGFFLRLYTAYTTGKRAYEDAMAAGGA